VLPLLHGTGGNVGTDVEDAPVQDPDALGHIDQLAHEKHALSEKESQGEATAEDRSRLKRIEATLDQCWGDLNRRRALRDARRNLDDAQIRDTFTVERHAQQRRRDHGRPIANETWAGERGPRARLSVTRWRRPAC